ncbi:beta-N-acetylhexosaminidase [Novosphingobium sp. CF614]|uniref:glycoside hydrolase family 3 protein n=1 Tax=Novosphingobium sp. CF614 TaxID=1884364 RepID=UPI0008F05F68|nr:glycoside hydrolase family 3 N-terminal domain-containing protein [Novosphingobium sp. CF614]SFF91155.1 beta-N-acetylhexosaminidase [Novosphingobium sp. CF614]
MHDVTDRATLDPLAIDAAAQAWVTRTSDAMSVEDKIAQLFILYSRHDTPEETAELTRLRPGGVHRFPTQDLAAVVRETRAVIEQAAVPPIISGDIEGGAVNYPFASPVPNQLGIAACDDLELSAALADVIARESRALGYDWSFTPVVDLNIAFRSAVVGTRSYGSDPDAVLAQARTYVRVLQDHGIAATAKHWPGEGFDPRDQHLVTTVNPLSMDAWEATFGRIYRGLIADGVMTVMSAHIALPAFVRAMRPDAGRDAFTPASVSRLLNHDLLRERLGFRGLIVSDATVMGGLTSWLDRAEAVPAVIENGCDAFLFSRQPARDMALMLDGLRDGRLSEERLEEAVRRMLTLKARLGLHERSAEARVPELGTVSAALRTDKAMDLSQQAAGRSLTLVKDTQALIPIDPRRHRRVVVAADPGWSFFFGAPERSFTPLADALRARGFEVRTFDTDAPPSVADADLLIYLIGQEATPGLGEIHIDFAKLHGGPRAAMQHLNRELPTLLVSFGQPFYLYDAPNYATYINAYSGQDINQHALVERLVGEAPFAGVSPVDAFCGEEQLQW